MSELHYKGYSGSVEYSQEDDVLHGRVLGINDLVTYEGRTLEEIKQYFTKAVEGYLAMCRELGQDPDKPFSGRFNVRISPQLHRALAVKARQSGISLNALVERAIKEALHE